MRYAHRIAKAFGGPLALARAGGFAPTTVYYWVNTGRIPAKRQQQVLDLARKLGVKIGPEDFFDGD